MRLFLPGILGLFIFSKAAAQEVQLHWAKVLSEGQAYSRSTAVDAQGNVYTAGYFQGTGNFDPASGNPAAILTAVGSSDIFISKVDADGNFPTMISR